MAYAGAAAKGETMVNSRARNIFNGLLRARFFAFLRLKGAFLAQVQAGNKSFCAAVNYQGLTHNRRSNDGFTMMALLCSSLKLFSAIPECQATREKAIR